ncbi:hydrogenase maturation nickel metallochaperone HypA [Candidatus Omnitrophota bacterium]
MHETGFANEIFSVLKSRFAKNTIGKVVCVNVKLSPFSHVTAQRLLDTYRELAKAQGFENVKLNIAPLEVQLHCRSCKKTSAVSRPVLKCPACESEDIESCFDKEFYIESVELNKVK